MNTAAPATLCEGLAFGGFGAIKQVLAEIADDIAREDGREEAPPDPLMLVRPAARGDLGAQRRLAMMGAVYMYDAVQLDVERDETATLAETIMFGRMAAEHGDDDDKMRLATLLALGATFTWKAREGVEWAAECVARLELLADDGHERAAELLASFAGRESPEVLEEAQEMRARLLAVKEAC